MGMSSMIEFKNVFKSFGERQVLKGISFSVKRGNILFVLGTSGTGKSVLLKNLVGLMRPDSGEILVDGVEISKFSENQYSSVRKKVGMVFQQPALFDSLSIFENIAYGLRKHFSLNETEIQERVQKALTLVHLKTKDSDNDKKKDKDKDKDKAKEKDKDKDKAKAEAKEQEELIEFKLPQEISYGMQKRVSLARTIALNPEVLLFDEPTTGLDPVTTHAINQLIKELSTRLNTTSIVVSHDMWCALSIADQIIVMDQGKIVEQGTPKELKLSRVPLVMDFLHEVLNQELSNVP
jgi:phospholipid/cholesterol/gamma-HCH transport system ATP-binding protein